MKTAYLVFVFSIIVLAILSSIGWVMNLVALFNATFTPLTGALVLRVVGIFVPPLGGFMGWFGG